MPADRVVLGGDHLGPEPVDGARGPPIAMARAAEMVRDYVRAGYAKIHLDASMRCADDPLGPLADTVAAARTADLAAAAEAAAAERAPGVPAPVYVDRDRGPAARGPGRRARGAGRHARRGRRAGPRPDPRGLRATRARSGLASA